MCAVDSFTALLQITNGVYYWGSLSAGDGRYILDVVHPDVRSLQSEANKAI